jgi:ElaB/YqjD/DUF883 family membrane-anchored ribosome-binding protein
MMTRALLHQGLGYTVRLRSASMAQSSQHGGGSDDLKDKATEQFKKVADRVEGYATAAARQLRDTPAAELAENFQGAVDKSVKEQPLATLALAVAVGFVLGALWKS